MLRPLCNEWRSSRTGTERRTVTVPDDPDDDWDSDSESEDQQINDDSPESRRDYAIENTMLEEQQMRTDSLLSWSPRLQKVLETVCDLTKEHDLSGISARQMERKAIDWVRQGFGSKMLIACLLYTSPSPRDLSTSRMPSSA